MVNMANLPQGKEFSSKGGVKSIERGNTRVKTSENSLVAEILISRGFKSLGSAETHQADAVHTPLHNAVLANGGQILSSANTKALSPEKALQAVKEAEVSKIPSKGISR